MPPVVLCPARGALLVLLPHRSGLGASSSVSGKQPRAAGLAGRLPPASPLPLLPGDGETLVPWPRILASLPLRAVLGVKVSSEAVPGSAPGLFIP